MSLAGFDNVEDLLKVKGSFYLFSECFAASETLARSVRRLTALVQTVRAGQLSYHFLSQHGGL
jgi:hypothetical protein